MTKSIYYMLIVIASSCFGAYANTFLISIAVLTTFLALLELVELNNKQ